MEKIQLLYDGDVRGWKTGVDCVRALCGPQSIWNGFEKLTEQELEVLETHECRDDIVDDIIDNAKCELIDGQVFTLHWSEGSIFAVEKSALEEFSETHF